MYVDGLNYTLTVNGTDAPPVKVYDPNSQYSLLINAGVPILCIAMFCIVLLLVYLFPNQEGEETLVECLCPEKGAKRKPRRRMRTNSHRLEEEEEV